MCPVPSVAQCFHDLVWVSSSHIGLVLLFSLYKDQGLGRLSRWTKVMNASLMVSRVVLKIKNTNFISLHQQAHMKHGGNIFYGCGSVSSDKHRPPEYCWDIVTQ